MKVLIVETQHNFKQLEKTKQSERKEAELFISMMISEIDPKSSDQTILEQQSITSLLSFRSPYSSNLRD